MEKKKQAKAATDDEAAGSSHQSPRAASDHEQELAATKIQSRMRGKQARRRHLAHLCRPCTSACISSYTGGSCRDP